MRDNREQPRRRRRKPAGMTPTAKYSLFGVSALVAAFVIFLLVRQVLRRHPASAPPSELVSAPPNAKKESGRPKRTDGNTKKLPAFTPDPEAVAVLGEESELAGRRLRLPRGWVVHSNEILERGQSVVWKDPNAKRDDNTAPQLQITVVNLTQEEINQVGWKPHELVEKAVNVETKDLLNVTRFPAEAGYINGVYGMRARWRATNPRTKRVAHGVVYAFFDNLQMVVMATGLTEPGHEAAIKLAEASMLSIRRN